MPGYNDEQKEAIRHIDGPMMVLAGPGCGKTAVISGRVENLIRSGIEAAEILVVTFTRAAAAEMRERFYELTGINGGAVTFGTFHSVFFRILKQEYMLSADCIISEAAKISFLEEMLARQDGLFSDSEVAVEVGREISLIKGNGISSKNYYSKVLPEEIFRQIFDEYRRYLHERRLLDFDDIITATYSLFKSKPEVLEAWRAKYRYILVDEFQDISPLQYLVVKMLAAPRNNLFIVGDDDQSIYRFRGAEPSIMLNFPKEYKDCRVVRLVTGYRSAPQIVDAASRLIGANKKRFDKKLKTSVTRAGEVNIRVFENVYEQADELSRLIRQAVSAGTKYEEIAVLVRTNSLARSPIEKLIADRIPFTAVQDIPCIFDHFIAKDIFAYLEIASGGRRKQDFLRIINKPNRYIARNAFYENTVSFEALYKYYEDRDWMWPRIEELEEAIYAMKDMPPYGAVSYVRRIIGYDDYIRQYALENNLKADELLELADEVTESSKNYNTLADWKRGAAEYSLRIKREGHSGEKKSVVISTLHGSKGMEYDIVFIIDVNNGIIPYHKAALASEIEEERRLFYVGMTRARYALNIFAVKNRYEKKSEPSVFLNDITKGRCYEK